MVHWIVKKIVNGAYVIDHLHRVLKGSNAKWKYPSSEDIQTAKLEQLVNCDVEGEWVITPDNRKRIYYFQY